MISVKCPKCGEIKEYDFKTPKDRFLCSICERPITAADVPEFVKNYKQNNTELRDKLANYIKEYEETGNSKNIRAEAFNFEKYQDAPYFEELWREFILNAVHVAVEKEDKDFQTALKNHAMAFDAKFRSRANRYNDNSDTKLGLFASILTSYHKIGTNNDWEELINQAGGNDTKFKALSGLIIDYIVKNKDRAFAMDIFGMLAKRANDEAWVDEGRIYIRELFSNDNVAASVFPRSSINGRTKKFFKQVNNYCKKYHKDEIHVENTRVWANYVAACRAQKRRNIIIISSVLVVVAAACVGVSIYMNAIKSGSVTFDIDRVIQTTYGEELDLSQYSVSYKKNSGAEKTEEITLSMLSGYDPELVDEQQTVEIKFAGVTQSITIRVNPATLATPVLVQSGSSVAWDFVPNAKDYNVYVNSTAASTFTTTSLSYDLSSNENYGVLNITVRANAGSSKYKNSEMSEVLKITKLQPPTNIVYENGILKWDLVEGATGYDLSINGTPYTSKTNQFAIDFLQGNNEVEIHAKSTDGNVIEGVTVQTVYYLKLNGITEMTYSANTVQWKSDSNSNYYSVFVDGEYWKDFTREYFNADTDGFIEEFGEERHEIGIVCKSSVTGTVPSETVSYQIDFGNVVVLEDGMVRWTEVGTGATYIVVINGSSDSLRLSSPYFSLASVNWNTGANTVSITATLDNKVIICETATVTKHATPQATLNGNNLTVSGSNNRYSLNGGEWLTEIPDVSAFTAGDYTLKIKTVARGEGALEIDSEEAEITIKKLFAPAVSVKNGEIVCSYDSSKYTLKIYISDSEDGVYTQLSDISEIRNVGESYIKATLSARNGVVQDADLVIDSDYSEAVKVVKLEAPTVVYSSGDEYVTTTSSGNVKFYYEDKETGEEIELRDGKISNLPKGIYTVYARRISTDDNELSSDKSNGVSVYNMNITLIVNPIAGNQTQVYLAFGGCEEIDSITYTLEINYFNADGTLIGTRKDEEKTINKNEAVSTSKIVTQVTYRSGVSFESGYAQSDIRSVEFIVVIKDGSEGQRISTTLNL